MRQVAVFVMSKTYTMNVSEPWFSHLRTGRKPVEGRKASPTWSGIQVGDRLEICNEGRRFYASVAEVTKYPSEAATEAGGRACLRRYLEGETVERALPGVATIEEGMEVYLQWSTAEEIGKYGMLGFRLAVEH
jgi:ASC-1-like (ASCH) protein